MKRSGLVRDYTLGALKCRACCRRWRSEEQDEGSDGRQLDCMDEDYDMSFSSSSFLLPLFSECSMNPPQNLRFQKVEVRFNWAGCALCMPQAGSRVRHMELEGSTGRVNVIGTYSATLATRGLDGKTISCSRHAVSRVGGVVTYCLQAPGPHEAFTNRADKATHVILPS